MRFGDDPARIRAALDPVHADEPLPVTRGSTAADDDVAVSGYVRENGGEKFRHGGQKPPQNGVSISRRQSTPRGPRRMFKIESIRSRIRITYANVMSTIAVFVVLSGGTAIAAGVAPNSVRSASVQNNSLLSADLKDGKGVTGVDVKDNSLTGADIDESTLNLPRGGSSTPSGPAGGALTGSFPNPLLAPNSVKTDTIADRAVTAPKIAPDAIDSSRVQDGKLTGADIADNSIAGADVNESTLGPVTTALLGATGRSSTGYKTCNPNGATVLTCDSVKIALPARSRVLLVATASGAKDGTDLGEGKCNLGTSSTGPLPGTTRSMFRSGGAVSMVTVTPPLQGSVSFGVDCRENSTSTAIRYIDVQITAVALSAN